MGFIEAVRSVLGKYATFSGRAPRSEYWWYTLFLIIVSGILFRLDLMMFPNLFSYAVTDSGAGFSANAGPLSGIFSLLTFLPGLAVSVRRLHDTDRSGWLLLLALIPLIGWIILIVWFVQRGTTGANRFGDDPLTGM